MRRHLLVAVLTAATTTSLVLAAPTAGAAPDGFTPSPHLLLDIQPGDIASDADLYTRVGDRVFFIASDPDHGNEPWVSDGTAAGTHMVADLLPGPESSYIDQLTAFRGKLYFVWGTTDTQLWVSDGTEAGTHVVLDIDPGGNDSVGNLARAGDALWFRAVTDPGSGTTGSEPWTSDGTEAGTHLVADIAPGAPSSLPRYFSALGGEVLFSANDGTGSELWRTDGTTEGTQQVYDSAVPNGLGPDPLTGTDAFFPAADGSLYFVAAVNQELWRTDGTEAGTVAVTGANPAGVTSPGEPAVMGGLTYFTARTDAGGREVWRTDGSETGTVQVTDIDPEAGNSNPAGLVAWRGALYFRADDASSSHQLWRYTSGGGASLVDGIRAGGDPSMSPPIRVGDRLWFVADDGVVGTELWSSDGTEAGTDVAADIWDGPVGGCCGTLPTAIGNTVAFTAETEALGSEPWLLTATRSTTTANPADSYSAKQARKRTIRVPVKVTGAPGLGGQVRLLKGSTVVGRASLTDGRTSVRITKRLPIGKTRLKAAYSGSFDAARSTSKAFVVRVRG